MVIEVHIGLVGLPGLVKRPYPGLEQGLDVGPTLRGGPVGEEVHEGVGIVGVGEVLNAEALVVEEALRDDGGACEGGGWDGAAPVLVVEWASGGWVRRQGGCGGGRGGFGGGELGFLGEEGEGGDGSFDDGEGGVVVVVVVGFWEEGAGSGEDRHLRCH